MASSTASDRPAAAKSTSKLPVWIFLILAIAGVLYWNFYWQPEMAMKKAARDPAVGQRLPLLELQPLTGDSKAVSLDSLRGKVALVNFWGTWCPPCRQEFPHIVELWDRYRDKPGFVLLSVSSSGSLQEDVESVRDATVEFLKAHGTTLPTYIDADGASRSVLASLSGEAAIGYPTTAIVDRDGVVRAVWRGYSSGVERSMERTISKLLAEK